MRFLKSVLTAVSFSFIALGGAAFAADAKNPYITLAEHQPIDPGKKVEVTEFFGYGCPHCNAFDPLLEQWVKSQGANIIFKRVPVGFRPEWVLHQKLYYTMEALGKTEEFHHKIFNAMHVEHQQLNTDAQIIDFAVKSGLDKQKFTDAYNSFGVQNKVRRAAQLQSAYKIDQVPLVAIDGRYITSPSKVGESMDHQVSEPELQAATLKVMDDLVTKSKKK